MITTLVMKKLKKQFVAEDDFMHEVSDSINQVLHSSFQYATKRYICA